MKRINSIIRGFFLKLKFGKLYFPSSFGKPIWLYKVKRVFIGKRFRIMDGARIETHKNGKITIGENCSFGQNLHLTAGGNLTIGSNVTISGNVFISDNNHCYDKLNVHSFDQKLEIKETHIGDYCFLGYGAAILPGTTLGNNVIVGALSLVKGTYPDNVVVAGNPAKIIKKYNAETK